MVVPKSLAVSLIFILLTFVLGSCSDFTGNSEKDRGVRASGDPAGGSGGAGGGNEGGSGGPSHKERGSKVTAKTVAEDLMAEVVTPTIQKFTTLSRQLYVETKNHCAAAGHGTNHFDALKAPWKRAMMAMHQLELVRVGPLAENEFDLSLKIYSWPLSNSCGVDKEVARASSDPGFVTSHLFNLIGLDAMEQLIFDEDLEHSCRRVPPELSSWANLSAEERFQWRCHYLELLAQRLQLDGEDLRSKWGSYLGQFSQSSGREQINELVKALFFFEKVTKDMRLGVPTGRTDKIPSCKGRFCARRVEHIPSGLAYESLLNNAKMLEALLKGGLETLKGYGLSDLLTVVDGGGPVANRLNSEISELISQLQKVQSQDMKLHLENISDYSACTNTTIELRQVEPCALFLQVKKVTDLLKTEFIVALAIDLPSDGQGDGD